MKKLVIIEASDHGKVVADIARNNGYTEILFLDDNEELSRWRLVMLKFERDFNSRSIQITCRY